MNQPSHDESAIHSRAGQSAAADELLQIVSFRVGAEEFGLDILRVQEIIRHQHLTRVPNSPEFVDGVINLRGKVIPVVALRKRFGITEEPADGQARIVVLEIKNAILGFIVDSVPEVVRICSVAVLPPPRLGTVEREYVSGVVKLDDRLLILLDVDRILIGEESELATGCAGLRRAPERKR
jgi:purine-binding chemotaxis protein CheW